ncbi:ArnT family glycosyltransferase [Kriegella aquimaris]|uniref:ArnT family glycosyltransferase n=1 Tax=Kriegella aquimaris TaxID=192904 RepID=UPI000B7D5E70|nr:glycosyltransferase family 39 protein [Kriegella aquimaris]
MPLKSPKLFLYFLSAVFAINLLQSYFTELIFDEAYYWHYAQKMAWGYFDHPPMVAFLIRLSSYFFDGELGVRFMSCLLSVGTLVLLWLMIDNPKKRDYVPHFFILTFSMTLLNAYGFFTLPDTPLLFFTALFLWIYKKFIANATVLSAIFLGIVMAALMYSKYHAVLVIFFVLLSNLALLKNKYAWLAVIIALLCYIPHFLWLYENDFVSIKYHLFERPNGAYDFNKYTLGFFVNLVAIFGFTFPWIYKALYKTKSSSLFTKALLYLTYGVILFFFISSFNRRVQTQWIIVISIPLAIIVFNYMLENTNTRKWIYRMGIINCVVLLFLRIGLIYEPLFPIFYETHGNKQWTEEIRAEAGDIPIVFENSYRNAPMYAFYSGNPTYSLNNIYYRRNQYSIDSSEYQVQHKKIMYVSKSAKSGDASFTRMNGTVYHGKFIENFESFRKLRCFLTEEEPLSLDLKKVINFKVFNPYGTDIPLEKIKFGLAYLNDHKQVKDVLSVDAIPTNENILTLKSNDTTNFTFTLPKPNMKNPGYFRIGISENGLNYGLNGENIKLK